MAISKARATSKIKVSMLAGMNSFEWTAVSLLSLQSVAVANVLASKAIVWSRKPISDENIIKGIHRERELYWRNSFFDALNEVKHIQ